MLLSNAQDEVYEALGLKFAKFKGIGLSVKNVEHSLCEFSKYVSLMERG